MRLQEEVLASDSSSSSRSSLSMGCSSSRQGTFSAASHLGKALGSAANVNVDTDWTKASKNAVESETKLPLQRGPSNLL